MLCRVGGATRRDIDQLAPVQVRLPLAQPHAAQQHQDVPVERLRQDGVEKRVSARVERIEEHQQHLWRKPPSDEAFILKRNRI